MTGNKKTKPRTARVTKKQPAKRKLAEDSVKELSSTLSATQLNTLTSPVITILAGDEKHKFSVHEYIFQNADSPALAALVSDKWKEGTDRVIDWSTTNTRIVLSVIHYLYNKIYDANTLSPAGLAGKSYKEDHKNVTEETTTQDKSKHEVVTNKAKFLTLHI